MSFGHYRRIQISATYTTHQPTLKYTHQPLHYTASTMRALYKNHRPVKYFYDLRKPI